MTRTKECVLRATVKHRRGTLIGMTTEVVISFTSKENATRWATEVNARKNAPYYVLNFTTTERKV